MWEYCKGSIKIVVDIVPLNRGNIANLFDFATDLKWKKLPKNFKNIYLRLFNIIFFFDFYSLVFGFFSFDLFLAYNLLYKIMKIKYVIKRGEYDKEFFK